MCPWFPPEAFANARNLGLHTIDGGPSAAAVAEAAARLRAARPYQAVRLSERPFPAVTPEIKPAASGRRGSLS